MTDILRWVGARGPAMLALGLGLCFVAPDVSTFLRPALPWLVPVVLGLAMARVDIGAVLREALRPRAALGLGVLALLMMPGSAALYVAGAALTGLDPGMRTALVYLAAAPPIASAANLCFLLGYDGRRALQVTLATTALTPLLGPLTVAMFLDGAPALAPAVLGIKLGLMIAGGLAFAALLRRVLGADVIAREVLAFDGVGVLALVTFVMPLFDGVPGWIAADPAGALAVLAVATLANLGAHAVLRLGAGRLVPPGEAGAYGVLFGNRTIALYLAALPPDAAFALFVALYQVPMLLTPLVVNAFRRPVRN